MTLLFCFLFHITNGRSTPDAILQDITDAIFIRFVLGTGRLTIARAIGQKIFLDEVREIELRKCSEKKKKSIVGIRTYAHFFEGPVQLPLAQ